MSASYEGWRAFPKTEIVSVWGCCSSFCIPVTGLHRLPQDRTCHPRLTVPGTGLLGISQAAIHLSAGMGALGKAISKQDLQLRAPPLRNSKEGVQRRARSLPFLSTHHFCKELGWAPAAEQKPRRCFALLQHSAAELTPSFPSTHKGENGLKNPPALRQCFTSHRQTCSLPRCYLK